MLKNVNISKLVSSNEDIKNIFKSEFNSNLDLVKKGLKSIQSQKCNWNKKKSHPKHVEMIKQVLLEEQSLKNIISFFSETKVRSYDMTIEDIQVLTESETIKSIKSIQSQKCIRQYDTDSTILNKVIKIESMLQEHLQDVKVIDTKSVKKSKIQQLINDIELKKTLNKKEIIKMLQELL